MDSNNIDEVEFDDVEGRCYDYQKAYLKIYGRSR